MTGGTKSIAAGENSFAYGQEVSAFGANSFVVGSQSTAGVKGWYYKAVDTANKLIYLTKN
jgi:hypothetical protein